VIALSNYSIKYRDLQDQAASLQSIGRALASFEGRLNSIAKAMESRDGNMAALSAQTRNAAQQLPALSSRATASGIAVSAFAETYLSAERTVHDAIFAASLKSFMRIMPYIISQNGTPSGADSSPPGFFRKVGNEVVSLYKWAAPSIVAGFIPGGTFFTSPVLKLPGYAARLRAEGYSNSETAKKVVTRFGVDLLFGAAGKKEVITPVKAVADYVLYRTTGKGFSESVTDLITDAETRNDWINGVRLLGDDLMRVSEFFRPSTTKTDIVKPVIVRGAVTVAGWVTKSR
jgi:hypothetical protein